MGDLDGRCLCGAVQLTCEGPPLRALHCQCTDCQKLSGGGQKVNIVVRMGSAQVTGPTTVFKSKSDSGNENRRLFCAVCGTHMLRENSGMPDIQIVHAGTFNNPNIISPVAVIWHCSATDWDFTDPLLPVFDKAPPS